MTLRFESDHTAAQWFLSADRSDDERAATVLQGPSGFDAYATVHFADPESPETLADSAAISVVTLIAGDYTSTPDDVFFALWDGWGELAGDVERYSTMPTTNWLNWIYRSAKVRPSPEPFAAEVMAAPRLALSSARHYLLFRGSFDEAGDYPARPPALDWPASLPQASLTWPADHTWFIAADVDASWLCVGGSQALIDAVMADPALNAEPASWGVIPPIGQHDAIGDQALRGDQA